MNSLEWKGYASTLDFILRYLMMNLGINIQSIISTTMAKFSVNRLPYYAELPFNEIWLEFDLRHFYEFWQNKVDVFIFGFLDGRDDALDPLFILRVCHHHGRSRVVLIIHLIVCKYSENY